jgi:hypothetical protein
MARARDRILPFPLGDQGLALRSSRLRELGGYPDEPLFEDALMARRLRRAGPIRVLPEVAITDASRFETRGVWRNFLQNALLVAGLALGIAPRTLVRRYYGQAYLERWVAADPGRRGGARTAAGTTLVIGPRAAWYPRGRCASPSLPLGVPPWPRSDPSLPR